MLYSQKPQLQFYLITVWQFFSILLNRKLPRLSPKLKSISTNARFLYYGKEFPEDETRTLTEGDTYTVKFFKESGNPEAGYLEGAETTKYYHSPYKIENLAAKYNLKVFVGDWKDFLPKERHFEEVRDQSIVVLRRKF